MTAFYETGAASGPGDLLGKLATFVQANTPIVAGPASSGSVFHDGDLVVGYNTVNTTEIHLRGGTSYLGASAWNAQPNAPAKTAVTNLLTVGPYTAYHFFCGDEDGYDYVHAIVELTDGRYRHFYFGRLVKKGSYTGGIYIEGTNWNQTPNFINSPDASQHSIPGDSVSSNATANHLRIDYDSRVNNFQEISAITPWGATKCSGSMRSFGLYAPLIAAEEMKWNLRTPLYPIDYFAARESNAWSKIGRMPNVRQLNMRAIAPEDEIEIGGETWKCFPVTQRQSAAVASTIESSGLYGYAHRMP